MAQERSEPLVFVTADKGLAEAAREKGLTVFDPLSQGSEELERIVGTGR